MLAKLKLVAYGSLVPLVVWFAWSFHAKYAFVMEARGQESTSISTRSKAARPETTPGTPAVTVPETTSSVAETNGVEATDSAAASTNSVALGASQLSKPSKRSRKAVGTLVKLSVEEQDAQLRDAQKSMIKHLVGLVLSAIGLGILIAYDTTAYFAGRGVEALFDDDHESGKDPEYERAEQVWAEGKPMEAIEMMRDYLKKNPREQYVALRIAEIYEKDFRNFLAAALEHEEVLKFKLPAERWGWTAIHLCNLYTKLGREDDHNKLLERIVKEYPKTAAAKKARTRLGIPEPELPAELAATQPEPEPEPEVNEAPPPETKPNLPRGFRPK